MGLPRHHTEVTPGLTLIGQPAYSSERRTWGLPDIQKDRDRAGDLREPQTPAMKPQQAHRKLTRLKWQDPPWQAEVPPKVLHLTCYL